jgi:quercetin dioxygenase-like cupin family protein
MLRSAKQSVGGRKQRGQERHELKTGDTIYLNSGQAHQMENAGAGSATVLCVAVPVAL